MLLISFIPVFIIYINYSMWLLSSLGLLVVPYFLVCSYVFINTSFCLITLRFHSYIWDFYDINKKPRTHTQRCRKNSVYARRDILKCVWRLSGWEFWCGSHGHNVYSRITQACFPPSSAYQNNDITEFEKILKTNHSNIMDDPFIREHIEGEWWTWPRSTCMLIMLK